MKMIGNRSIESRNLMKFAKADRVKIRKLAHLKTNKKCPELQTYLL